jgi:hypothetical protein
MSTPEASLEPNLWSKAKAEDNNKESLSPEGMLREIHFGQSRPDAIPACHAWSL